MFIGTPQDGIFRTTNGGNFWELIIEGLTSIRITGIVVSTTFRGDATVYLSTLSGTAFMSRDAGDNWEKIDQETRGYRSMAISPTFEIDGTLFTGTGGAEFSRSSDRGQTWDDLIVEPIVN